MKKSLMFAYGSNLDLGQMRARCPRSKVIGTGEVRGWRVGFSGWSPLWGGAVATVIEANGRRVQGMLWRLNNDDLASLDGYEGRRYYRMPIRVLCTSGSRAGTFVAAWVYVQDEAESGLPSPAYLDRILAAYHRLGFDMKPLLDAVREATQARRRVA